MTTVPIMLFVLLCFYFFYDIKFDPFIRAGEVVIVLLIILHYVYLFNFLMKHWYKS